MPLSSAEISQLNGSFMQQHMASMQYSHMIGPHGHGGGYNYGGYNTGAQNEGLAARVMNTGSAVAAPTAMLGLGLMGLDPISMGMRAGGAAMGAGAGFGGAALAGAAFAAPMAAGIGAVGYMGNQVLQGAQQTQQFNQNMRGGYSFFNPQGTHGRGFSDSNIREIGGQIRSMVSESGVTELGPSFNELGRLAANMGRLGLADGVRNAKEFTDKFREMMKSVKTIAEDMGTTLEEAQKVMASMKGSGVFKNQASVSNAIRTASVSGNLATTEVTGMMNIGSQISRMFGGTGKQGAFGGIKAIEQVGMAQEIGALSEEDIYNSTGLYGAEGRRAMAQSNMMQTGSFLKSSKGRWLLASLAGKDGSLDPSAVARFMSGGMGVEDTRRAAHENLRKIGGGGGGVGEHGGYGGYGRSGRANFIRNEGRLRGAVMEELGGLAPAMAMVGWAQGRGIDIHSMGDREMLFMQRQLGLGRDEADAVMKIARRLPDLLQHRREMRQDDQMSLEHGLRARDSGIEGVKRKLEAARDKVNNEMQRVGQDILNTATDKIASWGNRLAGKYEERSIEGIREAHRAVMLGGKQGQDAMGSMLGGGAFLRDLGGGDASDAFRGPSEDIGQRNYRRKVQDLQFSARMGTAGAMDSDLANLVKSESLNLKRAYAVGADSLAGLSGEDRLAGFKRKFGRDTELGKRFRGMSDTEQAAFMQQMEGQIGMKAGRLSETFQVPGLPRLVGGGEFRTEAERQEAKGRAMLGLERGGLGKGTLSKLRGGDFKGAVEDASGSLGDIGEGAGGFFGNLLGPVGGAAGALVGKAAGGLASDFLEGTSGRTATARAAGSLMDSKEMRRVAFDTLTGAEGSEERMFEAISSIKGAAAERGGMQHLTDEEKGKLGGLETIQLTADLMRAANLKGGFDKLTPADKEKFIQQRKAAVTAAGGDPSKVTWESVLKDAKGVQQMASSQRKEIVDKLASQVGRATTQESQALRASGVAKLVKGKGGVEELQLTANTEAALRKEGGAAAVQAAQMALAVQGIGTQLGQATTDEQKEELYRKFGAAGGQLQDMLGSMDVKSLRALGQRFAGTELGGRASELILRGQAIDASTKRHGAAGAIANQLGVSFGADEMKGLKGMSAEGAAAAIAARMGVGGDKGFTAGLTEAIAAASKKGGGIQSGQLLQRALAGADDETRKKLEEAAKSQQSPEEKIVDKIGETNKYLEALVKSNEASKNRLAEIATNTRKADGEEET